jgi:hypothetical protein
LATVLRCIHRHHGTAVRHTQANNEPLEEVGAHRSAIEQNKLDVWPVPGDHQAGNTAPSAKVERESGRNPRRKPPTNGKGPLRRFAERALSVAFRQCGEEIGVGH